MLLITYTFNENGEDYMKRKLKLPILLTAVVVMLSIFYIKEANSKRDTAPVNGDDLDVSVLNPEFTEARLQRLEAVNLQIEELEMLIAGGTLSADMVSETTAQIDELKEVKRLEADLEDVLMTQMDYDDVLVLLTDQEVVVDVYTDIEIDTLDKIEILKLAAKNFDSYAEDFSVVVSNSME